MGRPVKDIDESGKATREYAMAEYPVGTMAERRHNMTKVGSSNLSPRTIFVHEHLGKIECPYLERWVLNLGLFSIRLHHWLASDDQRHFHDHPWWYVSLVLRGSYVDKHANGETMRRTGSVKFFRSTHRHSVIIDRPCWTLLLTGSESRTWGFWVNGRFRKRNKYFYMFGHHPCDSGR